MRYAAAACLVVLGVIFLIQIIYAPKPSRSAPMQNLGVKVVPISHATAVLTIDGVVVYTDPIGNISAFAHQPKPDIVLVTDIHSDHFSTSTLEALLSANTTLIVPQAVKDELPADLAKRAHVLKNGDSMTDHGLEVLAMPMYNLPGPSANYHTKGRGNGYVLSKKDLKVYVAGDTAGTPEMRALKDIDVALIPMNLPYTMGVEEAASAVLDFKPKQVYPYHYRGQDGFSDVAKFKSLVEAANPHIEVVLLDWYPK